MVQLTPEHLAWARRMARAMHRCWSSVPVEDLEQEAALILWRMLQDYDPARNDSWQGFAHETVRRTLMKRCQQWTRWSERNRVGVDMAEPGVAPSYDARIRTRREDEQRYELAHKLVGLLNNKHAQIIREYLFEEKPMCDIAAEWGCSEQYISQLYRDALEALQAYMGVAAQADEVLWEQSSDDDDPQLSLFGVDAA